MNNISSAFILSSLAALKDEARRRFKAEIKGIFGSYARNEQKPGSDLDVLVEFEEGANLFDLVGLALFLEEKLNLNVDVVPESSIRSEIKDAVLREAVHV